MTYLLFIIQLLAFVSTIDSQDLTYPKAHSIPNPRSNQQSWIYDESKILSQSGKQEILNRMISELETDKGDEIMIAILPSIGDQDTKQFAVDLFENWKIGKLKKDNGLLILHVLDQRRIELETGYGLEGRLTDITCKKILDKKVIPYFKRGAYSTGYESLIQTLDAVLRGSETDPIDIDLYQTTLPVPEDSPIDKIPELDLKNEKESNTNLEIYRVICILLGVMSVIIYLLFPIILFRFANRWKTKYYLEYQRKDFFDLSSLFSFGLASILLTASITLFHFTLLGNHWIFFTLFGSAAVITSLTFYFYLKLYPAWESYLRDAKIICSQCSSLMDRLTNPDTYHTKLTENERVEREIRSYKFDLYECKKCKQVDKFRYPGSDFSIYEVCHVCNCKSLVVAKKTTKMATFTETGSSEIKTLCKKCGFADHKTMIIPVVTEDLSDDSSSDSSSSSSGSFSGSSEDSSSSSGGGTSGWGWSRI